MAVTGLTPVPPHSYCEEEIELCLNSGLSTSSGQGSTGSMGLSAARGQRQRGIHLGVAGSVSVKVAELDLEPACLLGMGAGPDSPRAEASVASGTCKVHTSRGTVCLLPGHPDIMSRQQSEETSRLASPLLKAWPGTG